MQRPGDRPTLSRIGGSELPALRVLAIVAGLIVLAVLKPWGGSGPETSGAGPGATGPSAGSPLGSAAERAVEPTPRPTPNPDEILCFGDGWRLVTLQTYDDRQGGTWVVVEPVSAVGPADPAIPVTRLVEGNVSGLGFCDNASTDVTGPARVLGVWWLRVGADGFEVQWLGAPRPYRGRVSTGPPAAILYDPPEGFHGDVIPGRPEAGSTAVPTAPRLRPQQRRSHPTAVGRPAGTSFSSSLAGFRSGSGWTSCGRRRTPRPRTGASPSTAPPSASARTPARTGPSAPSAPSASASAGPVPSGR